jgi:large subunit ribosomal protein L23
MNINEVLIQPTFTEKSTLNQEFGRYTFKIQPTANKVQVKEAVERSFNVTVTAVNITMNRGKRHKYGPRFKTTPDTKKAVVTLKHGDRINLIEGL